MSVTLSLLVDGMKYVSEILAEGYNDADVGPDWLPSGLREFLIFTSNLHQFVAATLKGTNLKKNRNENLDTIFLCLTQICTNFSRLDQTIKMEYECSQILGTSREFFIDRIYWCLNRLKDTLFLLVLEAKNGPTQKPLEHYSFGELMDMALDRLQPYSTYDEARKSQSTEFLKIRDAEAVRTSKKLRATVDAILSQTLALANVALDKKAISARCQRVLHECMDFEAECVLQYSSTMVDDTNRRFKAIIFENELYKLEDYVHEALLRLFLRCILDYRKLSIPYIRKMIDKYPEDDPNLDEIIADFDVNLDRITQIGIFAAGFSNNPKVRNALRSCLASMEALDIALIPSLQVKSAAKHSEILALHYTEEFEVFMRVFHEIVDNRAFLYCYQEIVNEGVDQASKDYDEQKLLDIQQMGAIFMEHFLIKTNSIAILVNADSIGYFNKFMQIMDECLSILCAEPRECKARVLKRFKIMAHCVTTFADSLRCPEDPNHERDMGNGFTTLFVDTKNEMPEDSVKMFESFGISPFTCSILYAHVKPMKRRTARATPSQGLVESLEQNVKKLQIVGMGGKENHEEIDVVKKCDRFSGVTSDEIEDVVLDVVTIEGETHSIVVDKRDLEMTKILDEVRVNYPIINCSVRRKYSLRTEMFKRRKPSIPQSNAQSNQYDFEDAFDRLSLNFSKIFKEEEKE